MCILHDDFEGVRLCRAVLNVVQEIIYSSKTDNLDAGMAFRYSSPVSGIHVGSGNIITLFIGIHRLLVSKNYNFIFKKMLILDNYARHREWPKYDYRYCYSVMHIYHAFP